MRRAVAVLVGVLVCAGAASARPHAVTPASTAARATTTAAATTTTTTTTTSSTTSAAPAITLRPSARAVAGGERVRLAGQVTGVAPGTTVRLFESPYPFQQGRLAHTTTAAADGSYSFSVAPSVNTRYRVTIPGTTATAAVEVDVVGKVIVKIRKLPLGQAMVTIVVFHPRELSWAHKRVSWWFAGGRGRFTPEPATSTRPLSPYVVVLRAVVTLPAGRFRFRACFRAPGDHARLDPLRPPGCSGVGYHGAGSLPVGFPKPNAVQRAARYLKTRTGRTAFAVVDTEGRVSGVNVHWTFITASVVKAMLLVAYLRRLDSMGQHYVDAYSNSFLYPMIHISDNNAASQCYSIVGNAGLYQVAGAAHMVEFSVGSDWGTALLSPYDQARFFFEMDSLIPKEFVGYARYLLSTIDPTQSWAIPVVARPLGYKVFFKDGSEPTALGQLVHQVARLEGHHRRFALAVMTDGDPTMQYGIDTIQGVAHALFR